MGVRIQELPETTGINKEDVLIVEDGQGTKKGTVQQLDEALGVSQLKEDLGNLDSRLSESIVEIDDGHKFLEPSLFQNGDFNISGATGSVTYKYRVVTKNYIDVKRNTIFSTKNGYRVRIGTLDDSKGEYVSSPWGTEIEVNKGARIFICIARVNEDTSITANINEFAKNLVYDSNILFSIKELKNESTYFFDEISHLLSNNINGYNSFDKDFFQNGDFDTNGATGSVTYKYRVVSKSALYADKESTLVASSGYRFRIGTYIESTEKYVSGTWVKSCVISANTKYMLCIARVEEDANVTADIGKFVNAVNIYKSVDSEFSHVKSSDCILASKSVEYGGYNIQGQPTDDNTRIRCPEYIFIPKGSEANVYGYKAVFLVHDMRKNVLRSSGWVTSFTFDYDAYVKIILAKSNDDIILQTDLDYIKSSLFISYDKTNIFERVFDVDNELPNYWKSYIAEKIATINTKTENTAMSGDSFVYFTDYHIEKNKGHSHKLIKQILSNTSIDTVVFGGDAFDGSSTVASAIEKLREFHKRFKDFNMYSTRGNHDYNLADDGGEEVKLTESQIYNYLIKPTENKINSTGEMYFFVDNETQKIRYIYLDSRYIYENNTIDSIQIDWMANKLTELESGWGAVIFCHQWFSSPPSVPYKGEALGYKYAGQRVHNKIAEIKANMSAEVICVITGHAHLDYSHKKDGILEIATTCDAMEDQQYSRAVNTTTEHAFDVFSIDKLNRKVYATRIGVGSDREWTY